MPHTILAYETTHFSSSNAQTCMPNIDNCHVRTDTESHRCARCARSEYEIATPPGSTCVQIFFRCVWGVWGVWEVFARTHFLQTSAYCCAARCISHINTCEPSLRCSRARPSSKLQLFPYLPCTCVRVDLNDITYANKMMISLIPEKIIEEQMYLWHIASLPHSHTKQTAIVNIHWADNYARGGPNYLFTSRSRSHFGYTLFARPPAKMPTILPLFNETRAASSS